MQTVYTTDSYVPAPRVSVVRTAVLQTPVSPQIRRSVTRAYTTSPYARPLETSVYVDEVKYNTSPVRTVHTTRPSFSSSRVTTYTETAPRSSVVVRSAAGVATTYAPAPYTTVTYPAGNSYVSTTPAPVVYTSTPTYYSATYPPTQFHVLGITQTGIDAYAWDVFKKYDVRGTGQLSKVEVWAALNDFCDHLCIARAADSEKARLFAVLNYSDTRTVSFGEFEYMLRMLGGIN